MASDEARGDRVIRLQEIVQAFDRALAATLDVSEEERAGAVRQFADSVAVIGEETRDEDLLAKHLIPALVNALRQRHNAE
jgi:hypothetical protein